MVVRAHFREWQYVFGAVRVLAIAHDDSLQILDRFLEVGYWVPQLVDLVLEALERDADKLDAIVQVL